MNCELTDFEILDFHFGSLKGERRKFIEGHLLECHICLKNYFILKSDIEVNSSGDLQLSDFTRHRIKAEFAAYEDSIRKSRTSSFKRNVWIGGVATAAGILLAVGSIYLRREEVPSPVRVRGEETNVKTLDHAVDSGAVNSESNHIL